MQMTNPLTVRALRSENQYLHKTITENETVIEELTGWLIDARLENTKLNQQLNTQHQTAPTPATRPVLRLLPGRTIDDAAADRAAVWKRRDLEIQVAALTTQCENLKAELVSALASIGSTGTRS
jgi:hypothetical protein